MIKQHANSIVTVSLLISLIFLFCTKAFTQESESIASPNLHQWGAVTLFHGLPSDHVRAIAQDSNGMMWFGTDGGLVKYDGRRIQKIATDGPAAARVLPLKLDRECVLWMGADAGASRLIQG